MCSGDELETRRDVLVILGYDPDEWSDDDVSMSSPVKLVECYYYPEEHSWWYDFINNHYTFHEIGENSYYLEAPSFIFPNFLLIIQHVPYEVEVGSITCEEGVELRWKVTEVEDKEEAISILDEMEEDGYLDLSDFETIFSQTRSTRRCDV